MQENKKIKAKINNNSINAYLFKILSIGLIISLIFMAAGFILNFIKGSPIEPEKLVLNENVYHNSIEYLKGFIALTPESYSFTGILFLILIPVAGVIFAIFFFAKRKNYKLALISTGVLVILLISFLVGFFK
jgi:uncharacterized membrane protein